MAKKQTYAALMKQLSSKKASYEKGLEEANRMGNHSGIRDYERRLAKLGAGMDELFQAQEVSKNPQMGMGGSTMKYGYGGKTRYADGGLTQSKFAEYKYLSSLLPQELGPEDRARLNTLTQEVNTAAKMGWQEGFGFNPDGSMASPALPAASVETDAPAPQAPAPQPGGPSITPEGALNALSGSRNADGSINFAQYGHSDNDGDGNPYTTHGRRNAAGIARDFRESTGRTTEQDVLIDSMLAQQANMPASTPETTAAPAPATAPATPSAPFSVGGLGDLSFMNAMNEQVMAGAPSPVTSPSSTAAPVSPTVAPSTGGGTSSPSTSSQSATAPASTPIGALTPLGPQRIMNTGKGDAYYGTDGSPRSIMQDLSNPTVNPEITLPTKTSDGLSGLGEKAGNFIGNNQQGLGMLAGGIAQLLPDFAAKRNIMNVEGPADMPQMRAQTLNTDIQTGKSIERINNQLAQSNAAIDRNITNPAAAAAMKRANQRQAMAQAGNVDFNEAQQEAQLRNQNIMQLTDVINQNAQIGFQNQQRNIDFRNERQGALAQQNQLMGQKIGGIAMDFQNRAADQKKWELYSKMFNEDMLKRQGIDPLN